MKNSLAIAVFGVGLVLSLGVARADVLGTITSPATRGQRHAGGQECVRRHAAQPNCVGQNLSPPLAWSGVPEGTKSFALLLFDPEGRAPAGVSHMVVYGIPADVKGFAEGEFSKPSDEVRRRQEHDGKGYLLGAGHAAKYRLAPLYLDPDRNRSRSQGRYSRE